MGLNILSYLGRRKLIILDFKHFCGQVSLTSMKSYLLSFTQITAFEVKTLSMTLTIFQSEDNCNHIF